MYISILILFYCVQKKKFIKIRVYQINYSNKLLYINIFKYKSSNNLQNTLK